MNVGREPHAVRAEDARIHRLQFVGHDRPETHLRDHVALGVESGRDLDQLQSTRADAKDGTLGHEQRHLAPSPPHARAVADVFEVRDEFLMPAFLTDDRSAVLPGDVEVASGQGAAENHTLRVLTDVDESTDTDDPIPESADIHVAFGVYLREGKEREIQSPAIVEVELRRLLDHRREILPSTRVATHDWRATDQPLLVGQDCGVEQSFLGRDGRQAGGHTGAEIAHRAGKELHRRATDDYLARAERQRLDVAIRNAQLSGIAWIVVRRVGLPLFSIDDHEVDEDARDLDLLAGQRAAARHALHLHDHDAASAPSRLRHRKHFSQYGLLFHRNVAVLVGRRAAQECNADRY